jgi:SAM-dependent methyltransferase
MSGKSFGHVLRFDPTLSVAERLYVRLLGVPILGLRIRARYLLPVISRLEGKRFSKIADAGSGRGLFTFYLATRFPDAEVVGMDIDRRQIAVNNSIAARLDQKNCRFLVQDVTELPAEASYGLILSTDNLEHLEDDRAQCAAFYRALAPGGNLLVHVPHLTRNVFGWRRINFMGIEGHVRPGYTKESLTSMLREAGLEIEEAVYSYGSFETLANDLSYLVTGGREKRRHLYALVFPLLLAISQLGRLSTPRQGSGVVVLARRPAASSAG